MQISKSVMGDVARCDYCLCPSDKKRCDSCAGKNFLEHAKPECVACGRDLEMTELRYALRGNHCTRCNKDLNMKAEMMVREQTSNRSYLDYLTAAGYGKPKWND